MNNERWGISGTRRLTFGDVINAAVTVLLTLGVIYVLFMTVQLIFFTVLNITCAKFRRATVKENYKGIKVLGYISETLIFLNVYAAILFSFSMIPEFINQWSEGELNIIILISAMLPLLMLGYGAYTWIHFLKTKRLYDNLFPKTAKKQEKTIYDSTLLFGDSKDPLEEQAPKMKSELTATDEDNIN